MKYHKNLLPQLLGVILAFSISPFTQAASVSDLLITEIMANPAAVSDANGEWLEVFNPTSESISLDGITLSDDGSNSHIFSDTGGNLLVASGEYFVLARNGDNLTNGNFTADYVFGSDFSLTNSSDQIVFSDGLNELLRFNYTSGFIANGASMELLGENMLASNYSASLSAYGDGDLGTPGAAGTYAFSVAPSPVPLPNALWLLSSGLMGFIGLMRKKAA